MKEPIVLTSDSPILNSLNFKPFRSMMQRHAVPFLPREEQPQTLEVKTPWGALLTAKKGDLLVSELDSPGDVWPINPVIFDQSYLIIAPGICVKRAVTLLVPLIDVTEGDEDQMVTIQTLEGLEHVRAGDFFWRRESKAKYGLIQKKRQLQS